MKQRVKKSTEKPKKKPMTADEFNELAMEVTAALEAYVALLFIVGVVVFALIGFFKLISIFA